MARVAPGVEPAEVRRLVDELGYDAAFDYHDVPLVDRLRELAPLGRRRLLRQCRRRVVRGRRRGRRSGCPIRPLRGAVRSGQVGGGDGGRPRLDLIAAGSRELALHAFMTRPGEGWDARFAGWRRDGSVVFPYATVSGLAAAPGALIDLRAGRFVGGVLVRLGDGAAA